MRCIGQLTAAVARIHTPQTAHGIQDFFALAVPHMNAFGMGDLARTLGRQAFVIGKGVYKIRAVERLQLGGAQCFGVGGGIYTNSFKALDGV